MKRLFLTTPHGFVIFPTLAGPPCRTEFKLCCSDEVSKEGLLADRAHMILLVDDDDDVRETSADMLEELGYEVVQASSGHEALSMIDTLPDLEVMVTDIRMPGMSGLELSDLARVRRMDLKIILISGYFLPQPIQRRFLQKPFRTHELDQAIQAELGHSA